MLSPKKWLSSFKVDAGRQGERVHSVLPYIAVRHYTLPTYVHKLKRVQGETLSQSSTIKNVHFYRHTLLSPSYNKLLYVHLCACVCVRGLVNERLTLRALPRARGGLLHWLWPSHPTIK